MRHRRGYALIEMVLVISGMAVIFGLCVGLIHFGLRLDRVTRTHLNEAMTIDRLGRQLRADSRAALSWKTIRGKTAEDEQLELTNSEGRTILYRSEKGRVIRTVRERDRQTQFESYVLRQRDQAGFSIQHEPSLDLAILNIPSLAEDAAVRRRSTLQLHAALGKDQRVMGAKGDSR